MKRGLKTLISGIVIFLLGAFVLPVAFILPIFLDKSDEKQFFIPGTAAVKIAKPGRYYLWNDFRTVYKGMSYNRSESIPDGLDIIVKDNTGRGLPFASDTSLSSSSGGSSKSSIGFVEVRSPGRLTVSVSGDSDQRVFSFSQSNINKMFALIIGGFGLSTLAALAGIGVSIWGAVKLAKANKKGEQGVHGNTH